MEGLNLIAHNDLKNPATEAYRVIRTSIQFAQAGKELKTLAVTSCVSNEGKSMTAANLAVVLTQAGKSVLLLDCDMRNPTVHKNFGLSNKLGLSSCISMDTPLSASVQATKVDNLYALTSGVIPPNPSELLGSERMRELLQEAREIYDYVLIDLPPVLPVADALVLGAVGGSIVDIARNALDPEKIPKEKSPKDAAGTHPRPGQGPGRIDVTDFFKPKDESTEPVADGEKCPKCGAELPPNAKFCLSCGERIQHDSNMVLCPNCGKTVPKGKFCFECGYKFSANTCPKCGATLPEGAKFCFECGERL